jgi:hypothetical protein
MTRHRTGIFAALLLLGAGAALAQAPAEAPKPTPEQQKLGYFVGKWTSEGETKPNPFMPAGKFTTSDSCEWFEGGFAVVCHSQGTSPMGSMKGIGIMGYSTEEKVYTYYGVDSGPMAMATVPRGTVSGDDWVYEDESKMGGKTVRSRYSMKILSPTSYSFKWEMQGEGGAWATMMEGKSTKSN